MGFPVSRHFRSPEDQRRRLHALSHETGRNELEIRLAKALGWTKVKDASVSGGHIVYPKAVGNPPGEKFCCDVPDFASSLNAIDAFVHPTLRSRRDLGDRYIAWLMVIGETC